MFAIELVLPFLLFAPRRLRLTAAAGIAVLQVVIALTGNYGFFNLLTLIPLASANNHVAPFRTINGYGLFAVMTTERREIIVQGSEDGLNWKTYVFRYKPGDPCRAPRWVAPGMPRLDWQMWFAALGNVEQSPWFSNFLTGLLRASQPVLDLLEENPFPGGRPRYVRALSDRYTFTSAQERDRTRVWWRTEPVAIFCERASLK